MNKSIITEPTVHLLQLKLCYHLFLKNVYTKIKLINSCSMLKLPCIKMYLNCFDSKK